MSKETDDQAERLRAASKAAGYKKAVDLAKGIGMNASTVRSLMNGTRPLTRDSAERLAPFLKVDKAWLLYGEGKGPTGSTANQNEKIVQRDYPEGSVAASNQSRVDSTSGDARTGGLYTPLTEIVAVIGSVQSGAWKEAYQLPETEWMEMSLPADARFPGIKRFALRNDGQSMNKVCRPGGTWVFVMFTDLVGQGPSVGQYVIVERRRVDGLVEATAKRFDIGRGGKPCLFPESDDPSFAPIPFAGEAGDEIAVVGRVTDILNPV